MPMPYSVNPLKALAGIMCWDLQTNDQLRGKGRIYFA